MHIVVAINEPSFWTLPAGEAERLSEMLPDDVIVHVRDAAALRAALPDADVLFATHLTVEGLRRAGRLRWMHSSAVGIGNLMFPEFVASPVSLTNSRDLHAEPIAEHALALMLAVRRQIHVAAARQHEHVWAQREIYRRLTTPLDRSTLAVIGLGAIGSRIVRLGLGLGMRVVGVRKRIETPAPAGLAETFPAGRLHEALAVADAVVLAVPHTPDTERMMGAAEFAAMRPGAVFVNVARGQLVDHDALVAALAAGRLAGAALDAFVPEPLPTASPLWDLPNLLITPHTAAFGIDYWRPAVGLFVENVHRFRAGEPLVNLVDKARGY